MPRRACPVRPTPSPICSRSGDAIVDLVAGLRPDELDTLGGRGRRLAQIAIRHADDHRSEIEAALAAAR